MLKTPFSARPEHVNLFQSAKRLVWVPVSVLTGVRRPQQTGVESMESGTQLVDAYRRCLGRRAPTEAAKSAGLFELRSTDDLSPADHMHTALLRNLVPCVDWRLVLGCMCLLAIYQAQVRTNAEAQESDRKGRRTPATTAEAQESDRQGTPETTAEPPGAAAALEDVWTRMQGYPDAPTEQEFREAWKQTHIRIMECEQCMLIGGALWSVDLMAHFTVDSKGAAVECTAVALASFRRSVSYWGFAGPKGPEDFRDYSGLFTNVP